jgi:predicted transcriptional regulator
MEANMDKIMSTRIDEAVIRHIGMLAKKLGTSKKAVLENAVRYYVEKIEAEKDFDVFTHTFGSWQRDESAGETVRSIKDSMRKSQERYKR